MAQVAFGFVDPSMLIVNRPLVSYTVVFTGESLLAFATLLHFVVIKVVLTLRIRWLRCIS